MQEDTPPGWLTRFRRGIVAGLGTIVVAVALMAVITLISWLIPGPDTASALAAIKAAIVVVLAGHRGGVVLDGTLVTLAPLFVSILVGLLAGVAARRIDSGSGFAGWCVGYGAGCAVLAKWAQIGTTHAPVWRSLIAGLIFACVVGGAARYTEQGWRQLSARWQRVIRAALVASCGYLLVSAVLGAAMVAAHLSQVSDLQARVAPGAAGLPIVLLGIAAVPNAGAATVGYLTGPGFAVGSHTSVSIWHIDSGRLPIFPLLAALPSGQAVVWLGIVLAGVTAIAIAILMHRCIRTSEALPVSGGMDAWADLSAAAVLTGGMLALVAGLAAGGAGPGSLQRVGATWWAVGGSAIVVLFVLCSACLGVELLRSSRPGSGVRSEESAGRVGDDLAADFEVSNAG